MATAEVSMTHMRTGLSYGFLAKENFTIYQVKCGLISQMRKQLGRNHVRDEPDSIIVIQGEKQFSKIATLSSATVEKTLDDGTNFYVLSYISVRDFEAERDDYTPPLASSSSDVPSQLAPFIDATSGLRKLSTMMENYSDKEIYHVFYLQGRPHIATGVGCYQIDDLVEASKEMNLVVLHSSDEEEEETSPEVGAFMGYASAEIDVPSVGTSCNETAEPEDEPAGTAWTTTLVMKLADTTIEKDINVSPTTSFSKFRKDVADVFYKDLPEKKKTKDVMSGKDFILTVIGNGCIIDRGNTHVKKVMTDGCKVEVKVRGVGGARPKTVRNQGMVKDKTMKAKLKAEELNEELSQMVDLNADQKYKTIQAKIEHMVTKANGGAEPAQDVIAEALNALDIQSLSNINDKSKEDGSVEKKLHEIAIILLGVETQELEKVRASNETILNTVGAFFSYVYNMGNLNMGKLRDLILPIYNQKLGAQQAMSSNQAVPKASPADANMG